MTETVDAIARERIDALSLRLTEQMAAQALSTQIAMQAAEKAVNKAEAAAEKRFEGVNEFRQTLSDQAANFITRKEVEATMSGVNGTLKRLEGQANTSTGKTAGADYIWRIGVVVVGLALAVATFLK